MEGPPTSELTVQTRQATTPTENPSPFGFTFSSYATFKFTAMFPKTLIYANRHFSHGHWLVDNKELIMATALFKAFLRTDAKSNTMSDLRGGKALTRAEG